MSLLGNAISSDRLLQAPCSSGGVLPTLYHHQHHHHHQHHQHQHQHQHHALPILICLNTRFETRYLATQQSVVVSQPNIAAHSPSFTRPTLQSAAKPDLTSSPHSPCSFPFIPRGFVYAALPRDTPNMRRRQDVCHSRSSDTLPRILILARPPFPSSRHSNCASTLTHT